MGQVYRIVNKINGYQYVGATKHTGKKRFREHVNNSKHPERNTYQNLAKAIAEFGEENFELIVMLDKVPEDKLFEAEKFCFRILNRRYKDFYNMTECGKGVTGFKHTEEDLKRISKASVGNNYASCMTDKKRAMYARRSCNSGWRDNISKSSKGKKGTFAGKHHTMQSKQLAKTNRGKPVYRYSLNGVYIDAFHSLSDAGKFLQTSGKASNGTSASYAISQCCRGILKTAYGYIWKFEGVETN